ncbi:MAG: tetratricopeptide repeat protein [Terrimicrobiaceae bacterium]
MKFFVAILILAQAVAFFAAPAPLMAQGILTAQGLTAQEYFTSAERLFLDGKYAEAADLYQKFFTDYGQSKEAADAIRSTRYRHAMCFVHMKKFGDAIEPIQIALAQHPAFQPAEVQELQFWLGVAEMEDKNFPEAREALEKFLTLFPPGAEKNPSYLQQFPAAMKIPEARILIGSAWLLEEKYKEAAEYYGGLKPGMIPESRSRAVILQLYSLLEDNQNDAAMKLIEEEFPRMDDITQLVTFQSLTLELGNRWLEEGEYRKAIACLQRVWTSDRLLKHQEERLEDLQSRLQAAEASPRGDPYTKFLLAQLIQKVKREIETFQKIPSFDAALRLRLATAYQAMKRYREAALILEDMLNRMPPDKIVEQASVNLVQAWFELERWPKVSEAAGTFATKFPDSASLPMVLYLDGIAAQKDLRFEESLATFEKIRKGDSPFSPRALFMKGFTLLLAERNKEAIETFEAFGKKYPDHELSEAAAYWRGMGYSLDKQFANARDAMDDYLRKYKDGQYAGTSVFRKAYCAQQLEDYQTSMKELRSYMRAYPGHEEASEARILLGDAMMNEGQMEEGIAVFKSIPKADTRFYEEGVFKVGKALKLMEENDRLLDHMKDFVKESPRSPRVAEAIFNIGWVYRQKEQNEKAREVYWAAIKELGDDPTIRSVEDLFPALSKLYKGEEGSPQYLALLQDLQEEAEKSGQKTMSMRALWAKAAATKKSDPESAQKLLLKAAAFADVQTTNPILLSDFAEALLAAGREKEGEAMCRDLVKWNPRASQKDRALATLGFLEMKRGHDRLALDQFDRFEKESLGSPVFGRVLLAKAELLEKRGEKDRALAALEAVLANKYSSGKEKAEALFRSGNIQMAAGKPELAVPYFQRVYVMHGRWGEWVAKAYFRSGEAFEKLKDPLSARKTYQELTGKEDLAGFPETQLAKSRLEALGGPLAEEINKG